MTDQYRSIPGIPGELYRQFKVTGTEPISGAPVYAEVLALEPGSIGGGGGAVAIKDGTTPTQLLAVDASGRISVNVNGTVPVSGTFWQNTQPVSGTFWQTTQPVSNAGTFAVQAALNAETTKVIGTVNIAAAQTIGVTGTFWQATQPVSGTFWQATQPVSIATAPALVASSAVIGHVIVDTAPTTAVSQSGTWNVNSTDTPPTLTKGTQGSTGYSTQDLKDAGRTFVSLTADRVTPAASDTLVTCAQNKGGATGSATSYTVTTGKTLRIQAISASIIDSTTTATNGRVRLRAAASGFSVSSPILITLDIPDIIGTAVADAGANTVVFSIPDGLEIPATWIIGLSAVASSTSALLSATVIGYEY